MQEHTLGLAALHQQRHDNDPRLGGKAVPEIPTHRLAAAWRQKLNALMKGLMAMEPLEKMARMLHV